MSNRFQYKFDNEGYDPCYVLVDTKTDREIATDSSEPEDATFMRHFSFVASELNALDDENQKLRAVLNEIELYLEAAHGDLAQKIERALK